MKAILISLCALFLILAKTRGQDIKAGNLNTLLQKGKETHSNAIIIFKDDKLVNQSYYDTVKAATKIEIMSCTKNIVALAFACMQADGLIDSLDEPVYKFYPEWKQGKKQLVTLRHLLTMTTGIQNNPNATVEIYPSPDFVQLALCAELSATPGENWNYNNKALNLLAGIFKQATGKRMDIYVNKRLFKPLGINSYDWTLDKAGNPHVMSGCQLCPPDFAKMGLLLVNKGRFNGKQIIPAKFIEDLTVPCKQYEGYGKLWWIDYEKSLTVIDDDIINAMIAKGLPADFINKIKLIRGTYQSQGDFATKAISVFGPDVRQVVGDNLKGTDLRLFKTVNTGNITYRADGYLGNYIIVDPKNKIVAIRMIDSSRSNGDETGFTDFKELVLGLTK